MAKDVFPKIKGEHLKGKDIPDITENTINYLKVNKECICGTTLNVGTVAYEKIDSLLKYIPPHSMSTEIAIFKDRIQNICSSDSYKNMYSFLANGWGRYLKVSKNINLVKDKIEELNKELTDPGADKIVSENQNIKIRAENIIKLNETERDKLMERKGQLGSDIKKYQEKIDNFKNINLNNEIAVLGKKCTEKISEKLNELKTASEEEMRKRLEKNINDIYSTMFKDSNFELSITDGYRISINSTRYKNEKGVEGSAGQNIGAILAFISSIIKIAKENKKSEDEKTSLFSSEPYPLVMEAPASTFDTKRIKPICEFIPQIAEQVIVFTKDTEGNLMKKYMDEKIGKELTFSMISEFHVDVK